MKNVLFLLSVIIFPITMVSQESILDKVSKETCKYLESEEVKNAVGSEKSAKLGLFILNLYSKYKTQLEEEGMELDFSKGAEGGRDFGEKVGINMMKFCPDVLIAFAESSNNIENVNDKDQSYEVSGELVNIEGSEFSTVILKDDVGKTHKFLWLENFIGSDQLIEMDTVSGIQVKLTYKNRECYSPQLKDYTIRKEIIAIEYIE